MSHTLPPTPPPPASQPPGRVLIVDDEASIRILVARILVRTGHQVDAVADVDQALAHLADSRYDVVLVDLSMPERNGLELLELIQTAGVNVVPILLTGTHDIRSAVSGMQRGAFDYLPKPVEPEALTWTVDRAVGVARGRRREQALERVVAEWAATFDACPDLLVVLDGDGKALRVNEAVTRRTGQNPGELVGREAREVFPGGLGAVIAAGWARLSDGKATMENVFDQSLGADLLVSVTPIRYVSGRGHEAVVVARDVTELVRSEEARAALLRRLLSAQEDERRRVARELHDGIGQSLLALSVGLRSLSETVPADTQDQLRQLTGMVIEAIEEARRISQGLRPTVLDDLGLVAALARLTEVFSRVHQVRAALLVPAPGAHQLTPETESAIYRIVQEALANVAKYAHAQTVDVVLECVDGAVRVSVSDDGRGFDPSCCKGTGWGLSGMRERATMLGGVFRVESIPGNGTTIDVRIPLSRGIT